MALEQQQSFKVFFVFVINFLCIIKGQYYPNTYYPNDNQYRQYNPYNPDNNPNREYSTYTFNNRRYGQYQPNYYGGGQPGDPRYPGQDERFSYDRVSIFNSTPKRFYS